MFSPIHASAGLLIARIVPYPIPAFFLSAASHYLIDAIPHGDGHPSAPKFWRSPTSALITIGLDLGLAATTIGVAIRFRFDLDATTALAASTGAIAPDLLWGGLRVLNRLPIRIPFVQWLLVRHNHWHELAHVNANRDVTFPRGLFIQLGCLALFLGLLWS